MNSQSPHGSVFSARTAEQVPLDLTGPGTPLYTILSDATVAYAGFPAFIYLTLSPEGGTTTTASPRSPHANRCALKTYSSA